MGLHGLLQGQLYFYFYFTLVYAYVYVSKVISSLMFSDRNYVCISDAPIYVTCSVHAIYPLPTFPNNIRGGAYQLRNSSLTHYTTSCFSVATETEACLYEQPNTLKYCRKLRGSTSALPSVSPGFDYVSKNGFMSLLSLSLSPQSSQPNKGIAPKYRVMFSQREPSVGNVSPK
jgi:hypothetical protein